MMVVRRKLLFLLSLVVVGLVFSVKTSMRRSVILMRTHVDAKTVDPWKLARQSSLIKMPVIILVNPFDPQNVGSVSRIMLNWGMTELRVVDPRCDVLSDEAKRLAVGSVKVLENAKIFNSLQECVSDLNRVIATTARQRDLNHLVHTPYSAAEDAMSFLYQHHSTTNEAAAEEEDENSSSNNITATTAVGAATTTGYTDTDALSGGGGGGGGGVGIVFGRERGGLRNDELLLADSTIHIPAFEAYDVLNLAQAVNIIGYEIWQRYITIRDREGSEHDSSSSSSSSSSNTIHSHNAEPITPTHSDTPLLLESSTKSGLRLKTRSVDRPANREELESFLSRLGTCLRQRGYRSISKNNNSGKEETEEVGEGTGGGGAESKQFRSLHGIYRRSRPTKSDIAVLQGMLTTLLRPQRGEGGVADKEDEQ